MRFCRVNGIVAAYETNLLEDDGVTVGVAEALVLEREGSGETVLIRLAFPGLKSRRLNWVGDNVIQVMSTTLKLKVVPVLQLEDTSIDLTPQVTPIV